VRNLSNFSVSVVICTRNRRKALKRCIDSIVNQSCQPQEIVVVDDASGRKTKEAINKIVKNCEIPTKLIVNERRKGSAASRNRGIRATKCDVIAFLDDDCSADKNWLDNLLKYYRYEPIIGVGGPVIELGRRIDKKVKPTKYMFISRSGDVVNNTRLQSDKDLENFDVRPVNFFQGGNMSYRRDMLVKLNGFDENFRGNGYREETDLGIRSNRVGVQVFNPKAYTFHYSAKKGGHRDFVRFNIARFLHWKIRNTCFLFLKHYSLLNALEKIKCQFEREIRGIAKGKPRLGTRKKFYTPGSRLVSIIYILSGFISGFVFGLFMSRLR
jgi:GT2 family glycosyltransferase